MLVHNSADLGAAIRARRRQLNLGQRELASKVGVQRQWVVKIESGKSTAEVGLVLKTLAALGLGLEIKDGYEKAASSSTARPPAGISYDIESVLNRTRPARQGALAALGRDLTQPRRTSVQKASTSSAKASRSGESRTLAREVAARKRRR
jgi:HTH-type transcriptional regulator/antitoxin HipB